MLRTAGFETNVQGPSKVQHPNEILPNITVIQFSTTLPPPQPRTSIQATDRTATPSPVLPLGHTTSTPALYLYQGHRPYFHPGHSTSTPATYFHPGHKTCNLAPYFHPGRIPGELIVNQCNTNLQDQHNTKPTTQFSY